MKKLDDRDLVNINGGGISIGVVIGISALVIFVVGVVDGFVNPQKCN